MLNLIESAVNMQHSVVTKDPQRTRFHGRSSVTTENKQNISSFIETLPDSNYRDVCFC